MVSSSYPVKKKDLYRYTFPAAGAMSLPTQVCKVDAGSELDAVHSRAAIEIADLFYIICVCFVLLCSS